MRHLPAITAALLLASCGGPEPTEVPDVPAPDTLAAVPATDWAGYYSGTLPCEGCSGAVTELWVRSDGTYILRSLQEGKDSLSSGTFGAWTAEKDGLLLKGERPEAPLRWVVSGREIQRTALDGAPLPGGPQRLEKLADEINDEVPTMRVTGIYRLADGSQTFRPCGSQVDWPAGMGLGYAEEEGEPLEAAPDLAKAYRKAGLKDGAEWAVEVVGHLGMGPAAEGDGADEYFYVHRLIAPLEAGRCP